MGGNKWVVTDGTWTDELRNVESIEGSQVDDVYVGSDGDDSFSGHKGNDNIDGAGGDDWAAYWDSPAYYENGVWKGVFVDLSDTTDDNTRDGWGGRDTLTNIENVDGSDFNDTIFGNVDNNVIFGDEGNDWIRGAEGDDTLDGDEGADTFAYLDMDFESGTDTLVDFESGVDKVEVNVAGNPITWKEVGNYAGSGGGLGDLLVWDSAVNTLWYENDDGQTFEIIVSPDGSISMTDIVSDSLITDETTGNTIWTGNDSHVGTQFNDTLTSLSGRVTLEGGMGNDLLTGGNGENVFLYNDDAHYLNSAGQDTITDFESGIDRIWLDPVDAVTLDSNNINLYTVDKLHRNRHWRQ